MKRSTRVWIGAFAAVATFASLVAFVGMRHNHWRHGMMNRHSHCTEQCMDNEKKTDQKHEESKMQAPANKTADSPAVQTK